MSFATGSDEIEQSGASFVAERPPSAGRAGRGHVARWPTYKFTTDGRDMKCSGVSSRILLLIKDLARRE